MPFQVPGSQRTEHIDAKVTFTSVLKSRPQQLPCDPSSTKLLRHLSPKKCDPAKIIGLKLEKGDLPLFFVFESAAGYAARFRHRALRS
jgi:hypothetical protein